MRLLLSATSPYARKVHAVLLEKGLPFELGYTAPSDPAVSRVNPLGKIPALLRDDGTALYDSAVIVQYLELLAPTPPLLPADAAARIEVLRWEALCDGVSDATVSGMLERRRSGERQDPGWIAHQDGKVRRGLAVMEADLGDREWAVGVFSLADIAIAATFGYVRLRSPSLLDPHPALADRYSRLCERPSIGKTAPPEG